jgi:hypothetical protein
MARRSLFLVPALIAASCAQLQKRPPAPTLTPALEAAQIDAAEAALYDTTQSLALEPGVLRLAAAVAKRDGGSLVLGIENAARVTLADDCADAPKCVRYALVAWLPSRHVFVVDEAHYEGGDYILVDSRDGTRSQVPAPPHFSPDGTLFATVAIDMNNAGSIDLWSAKGFRNVWHDERNARFERWDGNDALVVDLYRDGQYPPDGKALPARIVRGASGWTLVPEKIAKR